MSKTRKPYQAYTKAFKPEALRQIQSLTEVKLIARLLPGMMIESPKNTGKQEHECNRADNGGAGGCIELISALQSDQAGTATDNCCQYSHALRCSTKRSRSGGWSNQHCGNQQYTDDFDCDGHYNRQSKGEYQLLTFR